MNEATGPFSKLGLMLVVSGPSGAGKSTVCRRVLEETPALRFSVSCTTRLPRSGEVDGRDYHFLSRPEFERKVAEDAFLEHAEVHGNLYGTLRCEVERVVAAGEEVLLDIDVQGARLVRERLAGSLLGRCTAYVFFAPPSCAELERRLRGRATDPEEVIVRRLRNARGELAAWPEYDFLLINDQVAEASERLAAILAAIRQRTVHIQPRGCDLSAPVPTATTADPLELFTG